MTLQIHDTLKREKVAFVPKNPERVTMYVCGPTVYSYAHIGNARPVVVFDVLFRLLRHLYGEAHVVYARNITDVDDKINKAAAEQGVDISVITNHYADIYNADMKALGALEPTLQPRVTHNMEAIVAQIQALVDNGHAYAAEGHVLFDVESYKAYGRLSNRSLDDMIAGARVEVAPYKKNPQDFVLWKPSKENEPEWPAPWGAGRPGWHIECSAMIEANLGLPIDIHGGGHDLIFPHHENEIAQGVCAQAGHAHDADTYARYWMHNGFLDFGKEKMSKSLGNVKLVHDLIKDTPGEVLRLALLSAHYRAPLDWTPELITQTRRTLDRLYQLLRDIKAELVNFDYEQEKWSSDTERLVKPVYSALCDDLNTPGSLAALYDIVRTQGGDLYSDKVSEQLKTHRDDENRDPTNKQLEKAIVRDALVRAGLMLGILQQDPEEWFKSGVSDDLAAQVETLIAERAAARAAKNWAESDRIRDALNALNVEVMDGPAGATWKLKVGAQ